MQDATQMMIARGSTPAGPMALLRKQSIIQSPRWALSVLIGDATVDTINEIANPDLSKSERDYTQVKQFEF